jgi:A/G-specific adenine glycosylase
MVSEVMLQQTQVATVLPYYQQWLKRFPSFAALAAASESEILHAWEGLGYYSRARNLHSAAKQVVRQYQGVLPREPDEIRRLPGLGRYTSNAVATFAFDRSVPIVEANITRVLARFFNIRLAVDSSAGRKRLWDAAESLLPKRNPSTFNSALMELGALVCVKTPRCQVCPVNSFCRAQHPELLPIKRPRRQTIELTESHEFVRRNGKLLLQKCCNRWRGMWMLPPLSTAPTEKQLIHSSVFPFTNHRISLLVFRGRRSKSSATQKWVSGHEIDKLPIPSPHRRAITALLSTDVERLG